MLTAEPLISSCALLSGPGEVVYPPGLTLQREDLFNDVAQSETIEREYDLYTELASRGEELEYRLTDLDGAIADAVKLKFLEQPLTKEQIAELLQIPPRKK